METKSIKFPETLVEAVRQFSDLDYATEFFAKLRWPTGAACPHCGSVNVDYIAKRRVWECRENHKRAQFSVKIGTIFEECRLPIDKCLIAVWLEVNAKNSISSYEIARHLGVTQKTGWFLLHRIRLALKVGSFEKMTGEVESDESYIGGKGFNMHASKRKAIGLTSGVGVCKAVVHGLLERGSAKGHSRVKATVVPDAKLTSLLPILSKSIEKGATLYSDSAPVYTNRNITDAFVHSVIDHAQAYVMGRCHTNSLENFWSLFKRCIRGTHVNIEPVHLQAYLDSEVFRFNQRGGTDGTRFIGALSGVTGKRLTYKALIGALEVAPGSDRDAGDESLPN